MKVAYVVLLPPCLYLSPPLPGVGFPSEQTALRPGDPSLQADGGKVSIRDFGVGDQRGRSLTLLTSPGTIRTFARALQQAIKR